MKSNYLTLLCLILFTTFGDKLNAQLVNPKLAEALQHTLDSMRQILDVNGLSAAVQIPNDAVWAGGSGVSTFSPVDSLGPEHIFETGSSTKTITAMCILQLVDEGAISLEDGLHQWLPTYEYIDSTITIRQLLQHRSGIFDVLQNPNFQPTLLQAPSQVWTAEEAIEQFIQAPAFQPGTNWGYSNTNYLLLGMIIESVTGNTFLQELENRFFIPLGLDSYINPAFENISEPYAHLWLDLNGDGVLDDASDFMISWVSLFSIIGPAGGYFATSSDLAKWIKTSMSGSLLSPQIWEEATQFVATSLPLNSKYGLGMTEQEHLGLTAYGHGGDLSYSTQALYFPEKDISIVVNSNDASIVSWNLTSTLRALLQTYIDCEAIITTTESIEHAQVSVIVSPNPFTDKTNVEINSPNSITDLEITVFDLAGKIIWRKKQEVSAGINNIELSFNKELTSGNYLLHINAGNTLIGNQILVRQ